MSTLLRAIRAGEADSWLSALYIERERCEALCEAFVRCFGAEPERLVSVPGRTELGATIPTISMAGFSVRPFRWTRWPRCAAGTIL